MRRRMLSAAAFCAVAMGGTALTYLGERRTVHRPPLDPRLGHRLPAEAVTVEAFDGTRLRAEVLGPAGAPSVVLVHGLALSQQAWHHQRRDLSKTFRVVSFDLRGHGHSDPAASGDYSAAALGRDLSAVVAACVPAGRTLVLVGHSLGGMAALSCIEHDPDLLAGRVAGVVLVGTAASRIVGGLARSAAVAGLSAAQSMAGLGTRRTTAGSPAAVRPDAEPAGGIAHLLTRQFGLNSDAAAADVEFVAHLNRQCAGTVKAAFGSTLSGIDLLEAAALVTVPAVVMVGSVDRLTPPWQARRLVAALPDAELVEIPGVGHTAMVEAHERVTAELAGFCRRVLTVAA